MRHFVVTIAREYGSGGLEIGKRLAEYLGVNYYDRELVELAAEALDEDVSSIRRVDESHSSGISDFIKISGASGSRLQDRVIEAQSYIIRSRADAESCVIIGRCADYVLRDRSDCVNVLIRAPFNKRMESICKNKKLQGCLDFGVQEESYAELSVEIAAEIRRVDMARDSYYQYVTGYERNKIDEKHIIIDSSLLGIDKTAVLLAQLVTAKFG